jgi:acyl-CoA synthetase (AMP-forming)/AMP-acid ligase II/thioesterase domain-containing protein
MPDGAEMSNKRPGEFSPFRCESYAATIAELLAPHRGSPRPALLTPGRAALSYSDLSGFLDDTRNRLRALGVGPEHRVAALLPNGPEMATSFLAVSASAGFAPLNPTFSQKDCEFHFEESKADVLLLESGSGSPAAAAAGRCGIPVIHLERDPAVAGVFRLAGQGVTSRPRGQNRQAALLLPTSGTTSRPKLVPLLQSNLCASAAHIAQTLHLTPSDRCLNIMPLFHIHGLVAAVLASMAAGASVVCTDGVYATRFFDWLEEFQPSWFTAVPTMHQAILSRAAGRQDSIRAARLRFIRSSSASLPPQVLEEVERIFEVPMLEAYGMTEAAHQIACNPLPPAERKPGAVGPAAGPEIAVMNETGETLPADSIGEVVIKGPNITPGYEDNPSANADAFTNGWFRTGDQGYLDQDGYLHLTGRLKELINRGGEKISPREIDEVMLSHPAVKQALSFAVPYAQLGEEVAVAIELHAGASASERDLRRYAAELLPAFKTPKLVKLVDEIPKGPTGKLQRIGLARKLGVEMLDDAAATAEFVEPRDEVERQVAAIWRTVLGVARVGALDKFESLGGDSLLTARAVVEVNRTYGLDLGFLRFLDERTLESMAAEVRQGLSQPATAGELVPIRQESDAHPLFCVPGHGGLLVGIRRLALQAEGMSIWAFPLTAEISSRPISEIGEIMADVVEKSQPEGPLRLAGICFGGLVAFEAACCLESRGRQVELLAMIDTLNPAWRKQANPVRLAIGFSGMAARRIAWHLRTLRETPPAGRPLYLKNRIKALRSTVSDEAGARRAMSGEAVEGRQMRRATLRQYVPTRRFHGRALLFEMEARRLPAPMLGWQGFLGEDTVLEKLPFDTRGAISETTAPKVAAAIRRLLEAAPADPTNSSKAPPSPAN